MKVIFNYKKEVMICDGAAYNLDDLRDFLIDRYEGLVKAHRIKMIRSGGINRMTYDWETIFFKASESLLPLEEFILFISRYKK